MTLGMTAQGVGSFLNGASGAMGLIQGVRGLFGSSGSARAIRDQYAYQKSLQEQAQNYNTWMMKNRYQLQRQDLEKAGINPLYGLGSAPSPVSGTGSVGMPDYVGEKNGRMQNALNLLGIAQDWSAKKAQIENVKQQTETEKQNTLLKTFEAMTKEQEKIEKEINNKWLDKQKKAELDAILEGIKKTKSEIQLNMANASYIEASKGEIGSRIELNRAQSSSARALTRKTNAEASNQEAKNAIENPKNEAYGSYLKDHPGFAGTVRGAQDLLGIITAVGAGVGGGIAIVNKAKSAKKASGELIRAQRRRK